MGCSNQSEATYQFDKLPIDTSKWSATDTLFINLNDDSIKDLVLVFDKYAGATRPSDIQTPILFFLGKSTTSFSFTAKGDRLIFSPYYEFKTLGNTFIIDQNGIGENNKVYSNSYGYKDNSIVLFKEIVLQKIEKLKVDDNTGDVTSTVIRIDTLFKKNSLIPISEYNILDLVNTRK
jgi:hypothetical protein